MVLTDFNEMRSIRLTFLLLLTNVFCIFHRIALHLHPHTGTHKLYQQLPYSLDYSPGLIRVLTRKQSRKFELLFNKKWQKLEYNAAQKMKKINSVPD